jgi:hypothetical protein
MRTLARIGGAAALVALGFVLGSSGFLRPATAQDPPAAQQPTQRLPEEVTTKLKETYSALLAAMQELQRQNMYQPAVEGVNSFAISVGGLNVLEDLETTRSVDPETFAALYADRAVEQVAQHLARDDAGRLTYKGKVVRMYPIARIKQLFAKRDAIAEQP